MQDLSHVGLGALFPPVLRHGAGQNFPQDVAVFRSSTARNVARSLPLALLAAFFPPSPFLLPCPPPFFSLGDALHIPLHPGFDDKAVTHMSWGTDETIVFSLAGADDALMQVSASGGVAEPITTLAEEDRDHRWPHLLPGGEAMLFTVRRRGNERSAEREQLVVQVLATGARRPLLRGSFPRYVETGHLVFIRDEGLWAAPFDLDTLEVTGAELPVLEGVLVSGVGKGEFALAGNGTLAYVPSNVDDRTLVAGRAHWF